MKRTGPPPAPTQHNEIRPHRPNFYEGCNDTDGIVAFDTLEQLLAIPWVKKFTTSADFYQFSLSEKILLAEYHAGREWWVCGYVKNPVAGLPQWNHGVILEKTAT